MPPLFQAAMTICRRTQNGNRFIQVSLKVRRTDPGHVQGLLEGDERPDPDIGMFVDFNALALNSNTSPTGFGANATMNVRVTRSGDDEYEVRYEIFGGTGYNEKFLGIDDTLDLGSGSCPPEDPEPFLLALSL